MFAYISYWGLEFFESRVFSPLWHVLVTPENAVKLNAICAVVAAAALAFAITRLAFMFKDCTIRWTPVFVFLSFFAVPQFLRHIFDLSPLIFTILPVALSLAALALQSLQNSVLDDPDDERGYESRFCYWVVIAGALASVAAWEGTLGAAFALVSLGMVLMPAVCGAHNFFSVIMAWQLGFAAAFAVEGIYFKFPWMAFWPKPPPLAGLVVFFFICIGPIIAVRRLGENRLTIIGWAVILLISGNISVRGVLENPESDCERFAKAVLADLGDRRLIITDGRLDGYFRLLGPKDVRVVGTQTNADREYLVNFFDDGEALTNKALLVRNYYTLPEMESAAAEMGLVRIIPRVDERKEAINAAFRARFAASPAASRSNAVERVQAAAEPLFKTLMDVEAELAKPTSEQNCDVLMRGQKELRETWKKGMFRGTRLSNALLMADIMLGDTVALESDAITALMIDRNDPAANGALGAIRQEQGMFESAERYLRKGVKGDGVFAIGKLAILLIQTDRPEEAVEWARQAVELAPDDASMHEPLVAALIESGRFDEAEEAIGELARVAIETGISDRESAFLTGARKRLADRRKE